MKCHLCGKRFDWRDKMYGRTKRLDRQCKRCLRKTEQARERGRLREIKPTFTHFGADRTKALARIPRMRPCPEVDHRRPAMPLNTYRRLQAEAQERRRGRGITAPWRALRRAA